MEYQGVKEEGKITAWMLVRERQNNAEVTVKRHKETFAERNNGDYASDGSSGVMAELSFNVDHGYLEALVRGMKAGILTQTDYHNLAQCETLEGKNVLSHGYPRYVWKLQQQTLFMLVYVCLCVSV